MNGLGRAALLNPDTVSGVEHTPEEGEVGGADDEELAGAELLDTELLDTLVGPIEVVGTAVVVGTRHWLRASVRITGH